MRARVANTRDGWLAEVPAYRQAGAGRQERNSGVPVVYLNAGLFWKVIILVRGGDLDGKSQTLQVSSGVGYD